jgi:hypothetical protein
MPEIWVWNSTFFLENLISRKTQNKIEFRFFAKYFFFRRSIEDTSKYIYQCKTKNRKFFNFHARKEGGGTLKAASVHPFIRTVWIICSSIHILHLCMNTVCWSCIKSTFDIFSFDIFTIGIFSFYQTYTYPLLVYTLIQVSS